MLIYTKYTLKLFLAGVLLFALTGCDSGFEEVNSNPNANSTAEAKFILPYVQENALNLTQGGLSLGSLYVQYYSQLLYANDGIYEYNPSQADGEWNTFYTNILENLIQLKTKAQETGKGNQEALATIMQVWVVQIMTDLWGDIPYSEANLGNAAPDEKLINPKYDKQESIYDELIVQVDNALSLIDESKSPFGSEDLIYNGDMGKWKKFGNSLKLRILMRMSEASPSKVQASIQSIYDQGNIFTSNDDNAVKLYMAYPNNHPANGGARLREGNKVSSTVVDRLKALNDPRLRVYAAPNGKNSEYVGLPPSLEQGAGYTNSGVSPIGAYFMAPQSPGILMTYSEVLFILAEAEVRGWVDVSGKSAKDLYEEAITANMKLYDQAGLDAVLNGFPGDDTYNQLGLKAEEFPTGITQQEINDYLQEPGVAWDASSWRALIGLQKWIKFYRQGIQGWYEWRRLDYPEIEPGRDALLDQVPIRWVYPLNEQSFNGANREEAVSRMSGGDNLTTPVWWDK